MYTQEETEGYLRKVGVTVFVYLFIIKKLVLQFYDDWHSFDTSQFANHFTKDLVFKAANEPEINGLEALQQVRP